MRRTLPAFLGLFLFGGIVACTSLGTRKTENSRSVSIIDGLLVGGLIGNDIGNKLDQQAKELFELVDTTRTREGIAIRLESDLLFSVGKSDITAQARKVVDRLADIVIKYPEDHIVIKGFTDQTGKASTNQRLSEDRARALRNILVARGIPADQIKVLGMGSQFPIAPNDSAEGRAKNRRLEVEITIPDENMD